MKKKLLLQLFTEGAEPEVVEPEGKPAEPDAKDEKKYSDKDLDEIINKKFAKWKEKEQKAVDEAKKLAEMNATQRAEHERAHQG